MAAQQRMRAANCAAARRAGGSPHRWPVDIATGKGVGYSPPEWGGKPTEMEAARTRTTAASAMVEVLRMLIEMSLAFRFVFRPTEGRSKKKF